MIRNLKKQLRRKATIEAKKIKNESTYYDEMRKGQLIGYEEAANRIEEILKRQPQDGGYEKS